MADLNICPRNASWFIWMEERKIISDRICIMKQVRLIISSNQLSAAIGQGASRSDVTQLTTSLHVNYSRSNLSKVRVARSWQQSMLFIGMRQVLAASGTSIGSQREPSERVADELLSHFDVWSRRAARSLQNNEFMTLGRRFDVSSDDAWVSVLNWLLLFFLPLNCTRWARTVKLCRTGTIHIEENKEHARTYTGP